MQDTENNRNKKGSLASRTPYLNKFREAIVYNEAQCCVTVCTRDESERLVSWVQRFKDLFFWLHFVMFSVEIRHNDC